MFKALWFKIVLVLAGFLILQALLSVFNVITLRSNSENYYENMSVSAADTIKNLINEKLGEGDSQKILDADPMLELGGLLPSLNYFHFDNALITDSDGKIRASGDTGLNAVTNLNFGSEVTSLLTKAGTQITYVTYKGVRHLFVITDFKNGDKLDGERLVCYFDCKQVTAYINKQIGTLTFNGLASMGIVILMSGIIVLLAIRTSNRLAFISFKNKSLYVLDIDNNGIVTKSNSLFKNELNVDDVFKYVYQLHYSKRDILLKRLPFIIRVKDQKLETRFAYFLVQKTLKGFRLVGGDVTKDFEFINLRYGVLGDNAELSSQRQFLADYDSLRLGVKISEVKKIMILFFDITNLESFKTTLGEAVYQEVILRYYDKLEKMFGGYGQLYFLDDNRFALIMEDLTKEKKLIEDMPSNMHDLNGVLSINDNLIKIICYLIAVRVEFDDKRDKELEEVVIFAKEQQSMTEKILNVYHSVSNYQKNKFNLTAQSKMEIVKKIIDEEQIDLFFQPQYSLTAKRVVAFETLLRPKNYEFMNLGIQEFVEIAETNGFMIHLGRLIFNKAFAFAKEIKQHNVALSLNISPVQFLQAGFVEDFLKQFKEANIAPHSIAIEITETFLMKSFDETVEKLKILNNNGIDIHLDDFGVGYSSLLYLKRLPISIIKIDKEFITDVADNKVSRAIVENIVNMSALLGLKCIAEGVETKQQKELLEALKCDIIQGYYISRAIDSESAKGFLTKEIKA